MNFKLKNLLPISTKLHWYSLYSPQKQLSFEPAILKHFAVDWQTPSLCSQLSSIDLDFYWKLVWCRAHWKYFWLRQSLWGDCCRWKQSIGCRYSYNRRSSFLGNLECTAFQWWLVSGLEFCISLSRLLRIRQPTEIRSWEDSCDRVNNFR